MFFSRNPVRRAPIGSTVAILAAMAGLALAGCHHAANNTDATADSSAMAGSSDSAAADSGVTAMPSGSSASDMGNTSASTDSSMMSSSGAMSSTPSGGN